MKKISLLLILFVLVFVTGCNDKDDKKEIEDNVKKLLEQAKIEYKDSIKNGNGIKKVMEAKEINVKNKPDGGKIYFESSVSSIEPIVTAKDIIYGEYTCSYDEKVICKK